MNTCRSPLRTMRLVILVCQLGLILRTEAQTPVQCITSTTNRAPENTDINVVCGTQYMDLSIYLCPVYHAFYNESMMVLNNENKQECYGIADWTAVPPVLKFRFAINESDISSCSNSFQIIDTVGIGEFADYSKIQSMNISGSINSVDPSVAMITYRPQIMYKFSCLYPMQYLLNNTQLGVSGVNLAIKDENGTFISTLYMDLYEDEGYQKILKIPETGLNLKTKIYVAVKAVNLTERFNLLLDRCFVTPSPYPKNVKSYDLFVGCDRDAQTKVEINGLDQTALFAFEAFRFVEHKDQKISTFYLHCVTRLCDVASCGNLLPDCSGKRRRKREVQSVSENATITSSAIYVGKQSSGDAETFSTSLAIPSDSNYSSPVVAVIVCIVVLAIVLLAMAIYFALYIRQTKQTLQ